MRRHLYRSRDHMIAGVAGGLGDYIGVDPSIVRTAWVVLAILTGGILVVPYGVMWLVVPDETDEDGTSAGPDPGRGP
jgi:phage shock protein C